MNESLPILGAVFTASLLGSVHCAGMCGAFAMIAVSDNFERPTGASRLLLAASYNAGRAVTYVIFGALAGMLGAALDLGGSMVGVQRVALMLAGGLLLLIAISRIARELGAALPQTRTPVWLLNTSRKAHERVFALPAPVRALGVGLLTTLLPCGWLYTFVVAAAGTASPLVGAMVMAAFWLGTLPMMAAIGLGARALLGALGPRSSLVASVLLALAAVWTLSGRTRTFTVPAASATQAALVHEGTAVTPACHDEQRISIGGTP
jgi:sulfite exporter TauE/SafE